MKNSASGGGCYPPRPKWITPSKICRILHILQKPNSIIALLFIQNIFLAQTCKPTFIERKDLKRKHIFLIVIGFQTFLNHKVILNNGLFTCISIFLLDHAVMLKDCISFERGFSKQVIEISFICEGLY